MAGVAYRVCLLVVLKVDSWLLLWLVAIMTCLLFDSVMFVGVWLAGMDYNLVFASAR